MLVAFLLAATLACPRGLTPIDGDACAYLPEKPTAVVVYFHGMLPRTTDWSHVRELSLLATEAKKRNVALIAPRGEQGLCTWAKDVQQHWCWPSDRSQLPEVGRVLERITRLTSSKPVLAGFSNGGYLVTLLASETSVDAAAYVVMHAGGVTGQTLAPERARPTLLLGASKDSFQLPGMKRLATTLEEAKWPAVKLTVREGVHEVTPEDVKSLFDFVSAL